MKIFNKKENKNENKGTGNDIINQLALQEALRELKIEKDKNAKLQENNTIYTTANKKLIKENQNLENNLMTMIETYDKIKAICKYSKTSKMAKAILKELGE
jgi:hypothetical protein